MQKIRSRKKLNALIKDLMAVVFDFDGIFTDNRVLTLQDGTEGVFCWRGDGIGLSALRVLEIKIMVISTEINPIVGARCKKLKLDCIQNCGDKAQTLKNEMSKLGISLQNVAYVGNDINDLECLNIVGIPVCVPESHPDVLKKCLYVAGEKGGYGAVREFCDYIVKIKKGKLDHNIVVKLNHDLMNDRYCAK